MILAGSTLGSVALGGALALAVVEPEELHKAGRVISKPIQAIFIDPLTLDATATAHTSRARFQLGQVRVQTERGVRVQLGQQRTVCKARWTVQARGIRNPSRDELLALLQIL